MIDLKTVPLTDIEVGERYRKDLGDIPALAVSIQQRGLICPLAVCRNSNGEKPYKLLAGGRRYAACEQLNKAHGTMAEVPVRIFDGELNDLRMLEIELFENFDRKDMTFAEECALKKAIDDLQKKQHGERVAGTRDSTSGWSLKDTARALGESPANVRRDIELAKAIESVPSIFTDCKNKNEAMKMLQKAKKMAERTAAVDKVLSKTLSERTQQLMNSFIIADFFDYAASLESESFDLVELDPPYGIDLKSLKAGYKQGTYFCFGEYNEVEASLYPEFLRKMFKECFRLLKPDGWILCWYGQEPWAEIVFKELTKAGFMLDRMNQGYWCKGSAQSHQPSYRLASGVETFYYARKGRPLLAKLGRTNWFNFNQSASVKWHPTQRPADMMKEILETFCLPASRILVPCAGSGQTLLSAYEAGMTAIGCDLEAEYKKGFLIAADKLTKEA